MTTLLGQTQVEFQTDFAILGASQGFDKPSPGGFVGTCPGGLAALCGTKYAVVKVTAQRWDGRPEHQLGWQDLDEWPFAEQPGGGPLQLSGFDATTSMLDVDGLGRARVLVYARGRQRYGYSSSAENLVPEEWLLQFFPDPVARDALASDPRRLSGAAPYLVDHSTGWSAAMHAWRQTGWHDYLYACPGYYELQLALLTLGTPSTARDIAGTSARYRRWRGPAGPVEAGGLHDPLGQVLQPLLPSPDGELSDYEVGLARRRAELASLAGLTEMVTMADLLQAMENLGLLVPLTRGGRRVLVPNAVPGPVWDMVAMSDEGRNRYRRQAAHAGYQMTADDIVNLLTWAPGHRLTATARDVGIRLGVSPWEVVGAVGLLRLTGHIGPDPALDIEDPDIEDHARWDLPLDITQAAG